MSGNNVSNAPKWFLVVSIIALLWNLLGVFGFVMEVTMSEADIAAMPEARRALHDATPAWANAAFGLATLGGALGSLLLVLKRALAQPLLVLSLVAVIAQVVYIFVISNALEILGLNETFVPLVVLVVAVYLVVLARSAKGKGWLT